MAYTEPGAAYPGRWPQEPPSPSAPTVGHTPFPTAATRLWLSSMTRTALPSRTKATTSFPGRLRFRSALRRRLWPPLALRLALLQQESQFSFIFYCLQRDMVREERPCRTHRLPAS